MHFLAHTSQLTSHFDKEHISLLCCLTSSPGYKTTLVSSTSPFISHDSQSSFICTKPAIWQHRSRNEWASGDFPITTVHVQMQKTNSTPEETWFTSVQMTSHQWPLQFTLSVLTWTSFCWTKQPTTWLWWFSSRVLTFFLHLFFISSSIPVWSENVKRKSVLEIHTSHVHWSKTQNCHREIAIFNTDTRQHFPALHTSGINIKQMWIKMSCEYWVVSVAMFPLKGRESILRICWPFTLQATFTLSTNTIILSLQRSTQICFFFPICDSVSCPTVKRPAWPGIAPPTFKLVKVEETWNVVCRS